MSFRSAAVVCAVAVALAADLPVWISTVEVGSKLEEIFFRTVTFGANTVSWRTAPRETRPALTERIQQAPAEAQLYYLRAREAEAQLDFAAAEADWVKYAEVAAGKATAWREKADFHARRIEPAKEIAALLEAARVPAEGLDRYCPASSQAAWKALDRAWQTVADHLLPDAIALQVLQAWQQRYPAEREPFALNASWLLSKQRWPELDTLLARFEKTFPAELAWPLSIRAARERARGDAQSAVALYERSFGPEWQERIVVAGLHASIQSQEQAARGYYAAYRGNDAGSSERALALLIELLLEHAGQPFRFGGGDLSFYRDIATLDDAPGFWNGILSLLLNGQSPGDALAEQEREATPYFHRAAAAELLRTFDQRFPQSARRPSLHAQVIAASAAHAEPDRVIRLGTAFLAAFPASQERTRVASLTADAYARLNQTEREFALYDALLDELSAKADRVPIGEQIPGQNSIARNADYPRVLDRYIARLTALSRPQHALALYKRELDRNPNDPGLYERLAAYLEQNRLAGEIEQTYRRAMGQFEDTSWSHKLARYYLRQKMAAAYDKL